MLSGEYCSQCGQREGRGDLTVGDIAGELAEEFYSWDSRLWRTLGCLVFRPGFLTAEFIIGHRARYVPPFRLYLIISFVLFLVVSLLASSTNVVRSGDSITIGVSDQSAAKGAIEESGASLVALEPAPRQGTVAGHEDEVLIAPIRLGSSEGDSEVLDVGFDISLSDENSAAWLQALDKRIEDNAKEYAEKPAEFLQLLIEYLPQMMFLLLPVFALLLKVCYLFSGFHYLQHLVFSLHFHSFAYLLYLLVTLVNTWLYENGIGEFALLLFVIYLVMALQRAYNSGLAGAIGKAFFIFITDAFCLLMGFVMVSVIALALP
jgi:hypothetical protein